jgi:hypothetical protein
MYGEVVHRRSCISFAKGENVWRWVDYIIAEYVMNENSMHKENVVCIAAYSNLGFLLRTI